MTGILSEAHFANLRNLEYLLLYQNSFVDMSSCQLGPSFPSWLKSQKKIRLLDISNANISNSIPNWFWDISYNLQLINVSFNQMTGEIPKFFNAAIDFSSNLFGGLVPMPNGPVAVFDLSNNRFKGQVPLNISNAMSEEYFLSLSGNQLRGEIPADIGNMCALDVLDLSKNNLTGRIPDSIGRCSNLNALDLRHNRLSGQIPNSLGQLEVLQSLHLNDNFITGKVPSSLKNLSSLETLHLGNNELKGRLPPWLGEGFEVLRILNLRSNSFSGGILFNFSNLNSLQVFDLSENNLTGQIPKGLGDLKAMVQEKMTNKHLLYGQDLIIGVDTSTMYYEESLVVNLKNQLQTYTKTLSLVTAIDLSGNKLSGEIPVELTKLYGLVVLNLAKNHIGGQIPENISSLRQLNSLDLSNNNISESILSNMSSLSSLGYLNLSNNKLSGKIPYVGHMSTYDANAFEGNFGLCEPPLGNCPPGEDLGRGNNRSSENGNDFINDSNDQLFDGWMYLNIGLGFAFGILVPYLVLIMRKSWSDWYFDFIDKIVYNLILSKSMKKTYYYI